MFAIRTSSTNRLARIGAFIAQAPFRLTEQLAKETEREVMPLIQEGFMRREDPYGVRWPKPKAGNPPLERTGAGRRAYQVIRSIRGGKWAVLVMNLARSRDGYYYMGALQRGYVHWRSGMMIMPRRQVPDTRTMPDRWRYRFKAAARRADSAWRRMAP